MSNMVEDLVAIGIGILDQVVTDAVKKRYPKKYEAFKEFVDNKYCEKEAEFDKKAKKFYEIQLSIMKQAKIENWKKEDYLKAMRRYKEKGLAYEFNAVKDLYEEFLINEKG